MLADQTQTDTIYLTPAAVQAVKDLLETRDIEGYALRVYVAGGGCSGLQYGMALDNNVRDTDITSEHGEVTAIVDEVSIQYLRGATVDYVDDVMGSGFKIENPNAFPGCGSSPQSGGDTDSQGKSPGCSGCC